MGFGIPVTETDTINVGVRYEHTSLTLFADSPPVYYEFVNEFGSSTNTYILSSGWSRDTRDDILYPTRGRLQSALLEVGLPIGDLSYYKIQYIQSYYQPIYGDLILMLRGDLGYGDGYSGKPLPFFKAFYRGRRGTRSAATRPHRWGRATSSAMCSGASARSSATSSCSTRSSRATSRCA